LEIVKRIPTGNEPFWLAVPGTISLFII